MASNLEQLKAQRENLDAEIRLAETGPILERLQELGRIEATRKSYQTEFPLPYDAEYKIENGKLVIEGHASAWGFGEVRVAIPFTPESVEALLQEYSLEFHIQDRVDAKEAERLLHQVSLLKMAALL